MVIDKIPSAPLQQLIHDLPFTIVPIYWPHTIVTFTDYLYRFQVLHFSHSYA